MTVPLSDDSSKLLRAGALSVRDDGTDVRLDDAAIGLTHAQRMVLTALVRRNGAVAHRADLYEEAFGRKLPQGSRAVDIHIGRIRHALGPVGACIVSVEQAGYRIDVQALRRFFPSGSSRGRVSDERTVRIGFVPLTDCAPLVMAEVLGFFRERGLHVSLVKQASWGALTDNLRRGRLDAAHCLFSIPFSLAVGIGGAPTRELKIAMVLSNNGSAILLSSEYGAAGYGEFGAAARLLNGRAPTFGITFPGGTHDIWLRYWLRAGGIDARTVRFMVVPPPRMVTEMKVGSLQGSCVGEPWSAMAAAEGVAFTHLATQDLWTHHPEKALVVGERFAAERPEVLHDLMGAVLRSCAWLDDSRNHDHAVETLAAPLYVGAAPVDIGDRLSGRYRLGSGLPERTFAEDRMRFFRAGMVNAPRRSHGLWFLAQYRRLGLLEDDPPYRELVDDLVLRHLYEDVAAGEGIGAPDDDLEPFSTKIDVAQFDPLRPDDEARRL